MCPVQWTTLFFAELARWNDDHARALVADCAPQFVACFEVDHFPHHVQLKASLSEILPEMVLFWNAEVRKLLEAHLERCMEQSGHRNLKSVAQDALRRLSLAQ